MAWTSALQIGIAKIDQQHRRFFALHEIVYDAVYSARGDEIVDGALAELLRYCTLHFRAEETLMTAIRYPMLAEHTRIHEQFTAMVRRQYEKSQPRATIALEILQMTRIWIQEHIQKVDVQYADYMRNLRDSERVHFLPPSVLREIDRLAPTR